MLNAARIEPKGTIENPARVVIVDDSRTIRGLIKSVIDRDPRLKVVAEAGNAREARDAINNTNPDIMTLDVEMPSMSGIEFLEKVMRHRPMPVVMVSTLTRAGSTVAIEALSKGAIECVEKPRSDSVSSSFNQLTSILVSAANANLGTSFEVQRKAVESKAGRKFHRICLLGGSTGAVEAIETILRGFPVDCPPTVITQHMPAPFLASFAARLDPLVSPNVRLAVKGDKLVTGQVLIAPGGDFHVNFSRSKDIEVVLSNEAKISGHRPSVDSMFRSAEPFASNVVAGILTGMGRDGAEGIARLRAKGAITLGQSKDSCVVFGMPRVAGDLDGIDEWSSLEKFSDSLLSNAERINKGQ